MTFVPLSRLSKDQRARLIDPKPKPKPPRVIVTPGLQAKREARALQRAAWDSWFSRTQATYRANE